MAPTAREAMRQVAAFDETAQHALDDRTQRTVTALEALWPDPQQLLDMLADESIERRFLRPSRTINASADLHA